MVEIASYVPLSCIWILSMYNAPLSSNNQNCRRVMKPVSWLNLQLRRTVRENAKVNGYFYRGSARGFCAVDVFLCKPVSLYMCLDGMSLDLPAVNEEWY
jgi:hypothetical protein